MRDALQIMTAGLGGVFVGMALLYVAIRITSVVADRLAAERASTGEQKSDG
jgi:Na+-transporting methylmalonyl-CoA/oxaloacetate decarboxylase gamma subunit